MPPQAPPATESNPPAPSLGALADLQAQLQATQRSLADHVDKIHVLEAALVGQDVIKQEVSSLREMFEIERRELDVDRASRRRRNVEEEPEFSHDDDDDDDARSVATVTPHELESVEEEDEEQLAAEEEEERRHRRDELRPRTPEPTGMGMYGEEPHTVEPSRPLSPPRDRPSSPSPASATEERLSELANRLESALEFSRTLQAQHSSAQSTISMLEAKVTTLESLMQATQTQVQTHVAESAIERTSLTALVAEWKKSVEGRWSGVQEEWSQERVRLAKAHDDWEARVRTNEESISSAVAKVDTGLASLKQQQHSLETSFTNGSARTGGLVTPPSPRSVSSDSGSGSNKRARRRRSPSTRGRQRSHSVGSTKDDDSSSEGASHLDDMASAASVATGGLPHPSKMRHLFERDLDSDVEAASSSLRKPYPITPDPSVRKSSTGSSMTMTTEEDTGFSPVNGSPPMVARVGVFLKNGVLVTDSAMQRPPLDFTNTQVQISAAVSVLVVSAAAAAVLWRVKYE
jgi:hypothetical protein